MLAWTAVSLVACQNTAYGPWPRQPMVGTQRDYSVLYTLERPDLDGGLDEGIWASAAWADPFVHVSGESKDGAPRTWVKLLWDDRCLYVGALLEERNVQADRREHDAPIHLENALQVLLDPAGDHQTLHSILANAHGAILDERFSKAPSAGGSRETSWTCEGLDGGVRVHGTLNDSSDADRSWTVEMAIPWACLGESRPEAGDVWKANFLRRDAEEAASGESPQQWAWTPAWGEDAMEPAHWGRIHFARTR
jgi:hypothetical protein